MKRFDKIEYHDQGPDKLDRRQFTLFWTDPQGRYEPRPSTQDANPVGYRHAQVFFSDQWRQLEPMCNNAAES